MKFKNDAQRRAVMAQYNNRQRTYHKFTREEKIRAHRNALKNPKTPEHFRKYHRQQLIEMGADTNTTRQIVASQSDIRLEGKGKEGVK